MSKAIVLVAFGSADLQGIKKSIGFLEKDLNSCFGEEYTIFKAFTSNKIIDLLKERYDYVVPHLSKVLFNLVNQGYEEVIIQPLHIMSGRDKNQIEEIVNEYKYSVKKLVISKALFTDEHDKLNKESYEVGNIISENIVALTIPKTNKYFSLSVRAVIIFPDFNNPVIISLIKSSIRSACFQSSSRCIPAERSWIRM